MTRKPSDKIEDLAAPLSAKVMPKGQTFTGSGRPMTPALALRAQRQSAFARRQHDAAGKGGKRDA
jgi:hypothetical protein